MKPLTILYGVPSEGMGHAIRSKVIIEHLLASGHNVQIVSSARAFDFLEKAFPNRVYKIIGYHFGYKNSRISKMNTAKIFLKNAPLAIVRNIYYTVKLWRNFNFDMVISDFETFAHHFSKLKKIPLISIDNVQVLNRCILDFPIPPAEVKNFRLSKNIVKTKVPKAQAYLITSFFDIAVRKKKTQIIKPILRPEITDAITSEGEHFLIYQTHKCVESNSE
jgi:uncharacterized protein (TIGR00661 family)